MEKQVCNMASFIGSLHAEEKSQIFLILMVLSTKKDRFWCSHATGASLGKPHADEVLSSKAKMQEKSSSSEKLNFSKDRVSVASARACKLIANISWQFSKLFSWWPICFMKFQRNSSQWKCLACNFDELLNLLYRYFVYIHKYHLTKSQ